MSLRSRRAPSLIAVAGVVALVLVVVNAGSPPGAIARGGADHALLTRCARVLLGAGRGPATPVPGSADPQVVSRFAVFRRTKSPADALPAAMGLRAALTSADARTFDPSAAVLLMRSAANQAVYAVPATLSVPTLPADCKRLAPFAGAGAYLALQADETGSGSGVCLISTLLQDSRSGGSLPGARPSPPTKTLAVAQTVCKSEAILSGYTGALGDSLLGSAPRLALVPDGIGAVTYAFTDGRTFTVSVVQNLAAVPAALSLRTGTRTPNAAELRRLLAAHLPTTVTESGTGTDPTTTLTRPVSLIPDVVGSFSFFKRLVSSPSGLGGSSSTGEGSVSCRARTHRCVAVTVTTTCDSREHCRMRRTIHGYRYVGARPPAGTTGKGTLPTAPILARTNRLIIGPRKLTLVLSGTPHRKVVVLLSVTCFARDSAASESSPQLQLAIPSRTPIGLPGHARAFHACNVGALVTSAHRGSVHVSVARG